MSKPKQNDPWPLVLLEWAARVLVVVFSVALLSIFGYALVGGIVGTIGMMLHLDWLTNSAPPIGAGAGLVSGVYKFANAFSSRRRAASAEQEDDPAAEQDDESAVDAPELGGQVSGGGRCCRRPAIGELLKTTSLFTLIGGGLGMMLSAYLGIVLISVTTSPFAPHSWRPGTAAYVADDDDPVGSHRRRERPSGVGAGSSFYHPLLGPIVGYTVLPMLTFGFVAGIGFSFFPDTSESS